MKDDHRYMRPYLTRVPTAGLVPGASALDVRGIEVTQTVQDLQNSVVLVAGKATVVRVYLDPAKLSRRAKVTAELAWSAAASESYLPALNAVTLDPTEAPALGAQRQDLKLSLNFRLPAEALGSGTLSLRLSRAYTPGGSNLPLAPRPPTTIKLVAAPVLRVRVVGLRYRREGQPGQVSPAAVHFAYLRSFLRRAYPASGVDWSHLVVDANFKPPFDKNTIVLANAQIAAMRSQEVAGGVDPRTHYYGLVDDNAGQDFMRGAAFVIPAEPSPDVVASGPSGVPAGLAGDRDASYADWYGAHELGHTFGRRHPGFPPGAQDAGDAEFPYPEGLISGADARYVGFDVGDAELDLPMRVLPGADHHDVMTYADNQWLSPYTYNAVHQRLVAEEALA